jgi:uncharacterized protein
VVISKDLLEILVCPDDHTPLALADPPLLARLHAAIDAGRVTNRAGERVQTHLGGGLVRADGKYLYPVVDDIPVLLVDEAIPLEQLKS